MFEEMETVRELHKKGKMDGKLRFRLIFLSALTVIFGAIGFYNFIVHNFDIFSVVVTIVVSFLFGMFILYRMNKIEWDGKKEIMTVGRFDALGVIILLLYVIVRVWTKSILGYFSHNVVLISGLTIASVFGILLGRLTATLIHMHRIHNGDE